MFSAVPYRGNPLAVVLDGSGLTDREMARFANWTNLSETTFVLPPTDPATADYRLRIFTTHGELPFAGHPTLGSAHAFLASGGRRTSSDHVVQECGVGLVTVRTTGDRLAFAAPVPLRTGPLDPDLLQRVCRALRIAPTEVVANQWVDNGPGWVAVLLESAARVLAIEPDPMAFGDLKIGIVGAEIRGAATDYQLRALFGAEGRITEDPVTGSLNASVAQWLIESGRAAESYTAAQGSRLGRDGRIFIERVDGVVWVGGDVVTCIRGDVTL